MSLVLHLPFTNSTLLINNGLYQSLINVTDSYDDNGKLGKCLHSTTTIDTNVPYALWDYSTKSVSFGAWFKFNLEDINNSSITSHSYTSVQSFVTGNLLGYNSYGGLCLMYITNDVKTDGIVSYVLCGLYYRTGSSSKMTNYYRITMDEWTHIMCTFNYETRTLTLYLNGVYYSSTIIPDSISLVNALKNFLINNNIVFGGNGPGMSIPCYINDVRLYDHCLSPQEVKEIALGLVLHYPLNTEPFADSFRVSKLNGKSLVWNLLCSGFTTQTVSGITLTSNNDGSLTVNGTATGNGIFTTSIVKHVPSGHKVLIRAKNNKIIDDGDKHFEMSIGSSSNGLASTNFKLDAINKMAIVTTSSEGFYCRMLFHSGLTISSATLKPLYFDLTQMFGSGNEPTLNEFNQMFPKDYYSYDEGSFLNYSSRLVEWNLLATNLTYNCTYGTLSKSGDIYTYTITTKGTPTTNLNRLDPRISMNKSHKYYLSADIKSSKIGSSSFHFYGNSTSYCLDNRYTYDVANIYLTVSFITTRATGTTTNGDFRIGLPTSSETIVGDIYYIKNIKAIDLTQLFGYGHEPSSVEEFESWLSLNNITDFSYNAGTKIQTYFSTGCKNINLLVDLEEALTFWEAPYTKEGNTYKLTGLGRGYSTPFKFADTPINVSLSGTITKVTATNARVGLATISSLGVISRLGYINETTTNQLKQANYIYLDWSSGSSFNITNLMLVENTVAVPYKEFKSLLISWDQLWQYMPNGLCSAGAVKDTVEFRSDKTIITKNVDNFIIDRVSFPAGYWTETQNSALISTPKKVGNVGVLININNYEYSATQNSIARRYTGNPNYLQIIVHNDAYNLTTEADQQAMSNDFIGKEVYYVPQTPTVYELPPIDTELFYDKYGVLYGIYDLLSAPIDFETSKTDLVFDASGIGNNGTVTGELSLSTDRPKYDYSAIIPNCDIASSCIIPAINTVSFWIYLPEFNNTTSYSILKLGKYRFYKDHDGTDKYTFSVTANEGSVYLTVGTNIHGWFHCVIRSNGSLIKIYKNGVGGSSISSKTLEASNIINLGLNTALLFKLADVRVYATALSDTDIQELYNQKIIQV